MGDSQLSGCFLRVLHNGKLLFANAVLACIISDCVGSSTDFLLLYPVSCALYLTNLLDNKLNIHKEHIKRVNSYINI
jgi:hypothetical protein